MARRQADWCAQSRDKYAELNRQFCQKLALALSQQMSAHAQLLRRLGQLAAFADGAPLSSGEH